ncbi:MAG TPA: sensor histidine kinase [Streptosporangiaceae bacterium]|nr:sensor histidine kinase [Streptosporangiaceae bacterium]
MQGAVLEAAHADAFRHAVLFYRGLAEYRARVAAFVQAGLARREPVLLATRQRALPNELHGSGLVTLTDIGQLGRNPARIIPALRAFADNFAGQQVRIVCEFIWPGRSLAEIRQAAWNESLMDRAMVGVPATVVCPYSALELEASELSDAGCTHQWELGSGDFLPSNAYGGPAALPAACRAEPAPPPANAETIEYLSDLRPLRALVARACEHAGLAAHRATDLTIAVSELAANTLRHTAGSGIATAWQADGEMLCEISDSGFISDPLVGLHRPSLDEPGGQGLWLVNQVCDLVELRSSATGTTVRLHMNLDPK